ncbi:MAG: polysaccharide deacetylase family protein [Chloroflexota bacterium]
MTDELYLAPEKFRAILDFLVREFNVLPPLEFFEALQRCELPERAITLTFDDGMRTNVTYALDELVKRKLKAAFFVCPGLILEKRPIPSVEISFICREVRDGNYVIRFECQELAQPIHLQVCISSYDSRVDTIRKLDRIVIGLESRLQGLFISYLRRQFGVSAELPAIYDVADENDLKILAGEGSYIGNHTLYHSTIHTDTPEQFASDVQIASDWLDQRFARPVRIFCYPYGRDIDATEQSTQILADLGIHFGLVSQGGWAQIPQQSTLALHREQVSQSASVAKAVLPLAFLRHWWHYKSF